MIKNIFTKMGAIALGLLKPLLGLSNSPFEDLSMCDKATAIHFLESSDLSTLWDHTLKSQVDLCFKWDGPWLESQPWWQQAHSILELGSGNGIYLQTLSKKFSNKIYLGIEKQAHLVEKSPKTHTLSFEIGDAEIENSKLIGQFDVVLFRLTLQHLAHPQKALENAKRYLKAGGHILIIEACDLARKMSHTLPSFEEANKLHNQINQKESKGDRLISLKLLGELQQDHSSFEIVGSNLNTQGNIIAESMRFETSAERGLYFTSLLFYLSILNKQWHIPIQFDKAWDDLSICIQDESFWAEPGLHYLVLQKL